MRRAACLALWITAPLAQAQHQHHATQVAEPTPAAHAASPSAVPAKATDASATKIDPAQPRQGASAPPALSPVAGADRAAAFPPIHHPMRMHDEVINSYWLIERLEHAASLHGNAGTDALALRGWVGGDVSRLWLRADARVAAASRDATTGAFYGRSISAWWDALAGVQVQSGHGRPRMRAAIGVQGIAPGKFESNVLLLAGQGRASLQGELGYDTLLTNRLVLQSGLEATFNAGGDARHLEGSGLAHAVAGMRLRYELHRQFAPYVGVERELAFAQTARWLRGTGTPRGETRMVAGVRVWF